jgi:hypothetical protein
LAADPVPPVGCDFVRPVCLCDSRGQNFHWEFICERW